MFWVVTGKLYTTHVAHDTMFVTQCTMSWYLWLNVRAPGTHCAMTRCIWHGTCHTLLDVLMPAVYSYITYDTLFYHIKDIVIIPAMHCHITNNKCTCWILSYYMWCTNLLPDTGCRELNKKLESELVADGERSKLRQEAVLVNSINDCLQLLCLYLSHCIV